MRETFNTNATTNSVYKRAVRVIYCFWHNEQNNSTIYTEYIRGMLP